MNNKTMVRVRDYIPSIRTDLKYATADNFLHRPFYEINEAYLRYGTVRKLAVVQEKLASFRLGLKIWDAWRDPKAQFLMWELMPDDRYIADPRKGFSKHSRGNTVDVTLIRLTDGEELEMPSCFDDFTDRANRDYSKASAEAAKNARLLEQTMKEAGFTAYFDEWWHYPDEDVYEVVYQIEEETM